MCQFQKILIALSIQTYLILYRGTNPLEYAALKNLKFLNC